MCTVQRRDIWNEHLNFFKRIYYIVENLWTIAIYM